MISLDSSNLVLARMILMEAVTARMRITVNPLPQPPLKEWIAHASAVEGLWDTGLPRSLIRLLCHAGEFR